MRETRHFDLHGHRVEVAATRPWADAVTELLGAHAVEPGPGVGRPLRMQLAPMHGPPSLPPMRETARAPQLSFHRAESGEIWVGLDGDGWVRIDLSEERVDAWLDLDPGRDGWRVAHHAVYPALLEWLKARGLYPLHAGALAGAGGGILICGESGAGKTTLTLALALSGRELLGEDTCFFAAGDHRPTRAFALWEDAHLTAGTIERLPALADVARRPVRPGLTKVHVPLRELPGVDVAAECAPRWLLLPEVTGRPTTTLERVRPADALTVLTRQSLIPARPEGVLDHLEALAGLARTVEAWRVRMGEDLNEVVTVLGSLWGPDRDHPTP